MSQTDTFALDIETIPAVDDPEFDNAEHWIPFAIALGHQDESMTDPEVNVIFREDPSIDAEARMFTRVLDWIADRSGSGERVLLTYNGESYDIPILKHRSYHCRQANPDCNAVERLYLLLKGSSHDDLIKEMKEREGYWISLDDALAMHGIEADDPEWLGKPVEGSDMPEMGLELLSDRPNTDLKEVVRRYAASDVAPLFELHDKLINQITHQR